MSAWNMSDTPMRRDACLLIQNSEAAREGQTAQRKGGGWGGGRRKQLAAETATTIHGGGAESQEQTHNDEVGPRHHA